MQAQTETKKTFPKPRYTNEDRKKVQNLYLEGWSTKEIHELTKFPQGSLARIMGRAFIRQHGRRKSRDVYSAEKRREIRELRDSGLKIHEIAQKTGIPRGTIWGLIKTAPRRYKRVVDTSPSPATPGADVLQRIRQVLSLDLPAQDKLFFIERVTTN